MCVCVCLVELAYVILIYPKLDSRLTAGAVNPVDAYLAGGAGRLNLCMPAAEFKFLQWVFEKLRSF